MTKSSTIRAENLGYDYMAKTRYPKEKLDEGRKTYTIGLTNMIEDAM